MAHGWDLRARPRSVRSRHEADLPHRAPGWAPTVPETLPQTLAAAVGAPERGLAAAGHPAAVAHAADVAVVTGVYRLIPAEPAVRAFERR